MNLKSIRQDQSYIGLCVIVDITDRKRLDRLKDEFVSTVSHELRTPMTSIFASLALLTSGAGGKMPDSATRLLTIAYANCQRLVRLIDDILDIQKLESGQSVFRLERVNIRPLVEKTQESLRGFARDHGVSVRLDVASNDCQVYVDPDRLVQVVTNLLSNAVKFSPPDTEVLVGIERRNDTVVVLVRDRGPGIPDEFKSRIFQKFAQADGKDSREKSGTGLGLNIVKQIVERLGGQVGFRDAEGGGTVFYVVLPCAGPKGATLAEVKGLLHDARFVARSEKAVSA
jgi:signal transduction histidine kinase